MDTVQQTSDANNASGSGAIQDTSALAAAFERATPAENAPKTVSPQETATTTAGSQNTAQPNQQADEQVPWHKDPRWQKFQEERKAWESSKEERDRQAKEAEQLRIRAQRADTWDQALQDNPQLARVVLDFIEAQGKIPEQQKDPQQQELEAIAEKLLEAGPFKKIFEQVNGLKSTLEQKEIDARINDSLGKYQNQFNEKIKDLSVVEHLQQPFSDMLWKEVQKIDPESFNNYGHNPKAFEQAWEKTKAWYEGVVNGINSQFTTKHLNSSVPQTQTGGMAPLMTPKADIKDELKGFADQLRQLS